MPTQEGGAGGGGDTITLSLDKKYAKSIPGILKVIEFVFVLLAWACMAGSTGIWHGGRDGFYLFILIVGWLVVPFFYLWFLLTLSNNIKKCTSKCITITSLVFYCVWALFLLISAALVAQVCSAYAAASDLSNALGATGLGGALGIGTDWIPGATAAVVFGFLALVAAVVDIVFQVIAMVKSRQTVTTANA